MAPMDMSSAPRSLKERQRQEREELILQVAEEVLMEKGYHEASIDEIASRVGIAKGTVYLHFPSKENLVVAIFLRDMQTLLPTVDEIISTEASARSKIEAILHYMYGRMRMKRMQLLYSMFNSPDLQHLWREHKAKLSGLWEQVADRIRTLLEQGKSADEFVADIPTSVMISAFFCLLSPKSYERLMVEGEVTEDELANHLGRIYFGGITKL